MADDATCHLLERNSPKGKMLGICGFDATGFPAGCYLAAVVSEVNCAACLAEVDKRLPAPLPQAIEMMGEHHILDIIRRGIADHGVRSIDAAATTLLLDMIAELEASLKCAEVHKQLAAAHHAKPEQTASPPIPILLKCPECGARHVDHGDFATKPHHTHACQSCGHCWRPAVVATVGVQFLPGFKEPAAPDESVGENAGGDVR